MLMMPRSAAHHRLSEQQVADLKKWIDDGAAWPALIVPAGIDQSLDKRVVHEELKKNHWPGNRSSR